MMRRLVVLAALLLPAAWLAHEARWLTFPRLVPEASAYEAYRTSLVQSGIAETPLGDAWLTAGAHAVQSPTQATLPLQQRIAFSSARPTASAFRVALKRGQRVDVTTQAAAEMPVQTFVDVFAVPDEPTPSHEPPKHQKQRTLAPSSLLGSTYEAAEDTAVIVRIQPEIFRDGHIDVTLRAAPALRFPVANARPQDLQSVFGDPRDAGRREHEGVDIFATRGTPVVSATDGVVARVGENRLGGRVVWVWDASRGLMLYYAHLDAQLVTTGERVDAGEVLGKVGNTGNARTTAPHLHFGMYERGGAIDPYWFIAPPRTRAAARQR